ncbi:MAG: hypothetical protein JO250_01770 [Armatimonadetes bacterium]|nr:hypothetical protein [Armatimonadota bacterium]
MEPLAHFLCDVINPLLAVCVALAPVRSPRPGAFWARGVAGIGLAVAAAEAGKHWVVWPGHPTFPSGHETFALAAGTLLIRRDSRWLLPVLPLSLLLAWALVEAHYHQPVDVAGALLTGPPLALLGERLLTPRRSPEGA